MTMLKLLTELSYINEFSLLFVLVCLLILEVSLYLMFKLTNHIFHINFCKQMSVVMFTFFVCLCGSCVLKILTFKALFFSFAFGG